MLPLSTVEKPGFQNMLSTFDNRYQLPNRKYMSNTAIPSLYLSVKDKVADELKEMVFFFREQLIFGRVVEWYHIWGLLFILLTMHGI